ncbi:hypothetical protein CO683_24500 [Bradyrhizobium ottawaense]|nr:hypothetical protein [Bradyrhizobium sp. CCBAU 45394]PDT67096.1 hypothetical protein CO683_24500 [Bradyrhizobium ottawaense]
MPTVMLGRTHDVPLAADEHRRIGDYLLPVAFLGAAGTAMIAWIAAIVWVTWSLITWVFH